MADFRYALSIKQPWAALLIAGKKTIEIRSWPTTVRGLVLIHAGKTPDRREEAWKLIDSPELEVLASLTGGIIGCTELRACKMYRTQTAFDADHEQHWNSPDWYLPPQMYGYEFQNPRLIPFHPYTGKTLFFKVEGVTTS